MHYSPPPQPTRYAPYPPPPAQQPPVPPQAPMPPPPAAPKDHGALVQRLLLIAGATCVIVATSVYLAVAWHTIGRLGQAGAALAITAVFAALTVLLSRRGLPGSAQTLGAVTSAMLILDAGAAHHLDIAGARAVGLAEFLTVAHLVVLAGLVGLGKLTPRVSAYTIVGVGLGAVIPAEALAAVRGAGLRLPAAVIVVICLGVVLLGDLVARRIATRSRVAAGVAGVAATAWGTGGAARGLLAVVLRPVDGDGGASAAVLFAISVAAAYLLARVMESTRPTGIRGELEGVALVVAVMPGVAAVDLLAYRAGAAPLTGLGVGCAALVMVLSSLMSVGASTARPRLLIPALAAGTGELLAMLFTLLLPHVSTPLAGQLLAVSAVAAFAAYRLVPARPLLAAVSAVSLAAAAWLAGVDHGLPWSVRFCAVSVSAILTVAGLRARRVEETVLAAVASTVAVAPVLSALHLQSHHHDSLDLVFVLALFGTAVLGYSALGRRPGLLLPGLALLAIAEVDLGWQRDVHAVEAYSLPLALMAAAVGFLTWRRAPGTSSWQLSGPAVGLALIPSTVVALHDPGLTRVLLTLAVSVAVVLAGLLARAAAPIVIGTSCALAVAVSQLAPYAVGAPRWVTLGSAGIALLSIGVAFEQARTGARSAQRWYSQLR